LRSFINKVANVAGQRGSADCGLYAIAIMTTLASNENPTEVLYSHQDMRVHLEQCFDKGILEKFPVEKRRRVRNQISSEIEVLVYCKCRLPEPEDGSKMIQCDKCLEWYHLQCLNIDQKQVLTEEEWFCEKCSSP